MRASQEIAPRVVHALIDAGADPNRQLGEKMTAMMWAARTLSGHATVKALLEKGADPTIRHPDGADARSIALSLDRQKTVAVLDAHSGS